MFAKLLKHEFKASAGLLGVLCLASLGVGVGGGLIIRYMIQTPSWYIDDTVETVMSLLYLVTVFSLFAFAVSGWIYLCIQFYKRKFTDQGYLTFTLPVPVWQIYVTSFLNFLLWSILFGLAIVGSFALMFLIGFVNTEVWHEFSDLWSIIEELEVDGVISIHPLYSILDLVSSILIVMNCITFGAIVAKKHKVLCTIATYYLVSILTGFLSTLVADMAYNYDLIGALHTYQTASALISGAVGLLGAVLSVWLMKKKLNLP